MLLLLFLLVVAPASAADWLRPVGGDVVKPFMYDPSAPFVRGAHRGADFAARRGEPVRAPCSGRVTFAGRVPGGRAMSIRCGPLVATLLDVRPLAARAERVRRGRVVARAGGASVGLGARRAGDRFGYVDPVALLADEPSPLGPAPAPVRPRKAPRMVVPRVERPRVVAAPATVPVAAWVGLGMLAGAVPGGGVVRWRRRLGLRAEPAR